VLKAASVKDAEEYAPEEDEYATRNKAPSSPARW